MTLGNGDFLIQDLKTRKERVNETPTNVTAANILQPATDCITYLVNVAVGIS